MCAALCLCVLCGIAAVGASAASDLPHTADINAVNFSTLNLLHHITVARAQQPAAAFIDAPTDNITAVMQRLH